MAIVQSYRTCDICGKRMLNSNSTWSYHIEPPSKLKISIWKHLFSDPYDDFWTNPLDICEECWEDMRNEIRKRVESRNESSN